MESILTSLLSVAAESALLPALMGAVVGDDRPQKAPTGRRTVPFLWAAVPDDRVRVPHLFWPLGHFHPQLVNARVLFRRSTPLLHPDFEPGSLTKHEFSVDTRAIV